MTGVLWRSGLLFKQGFQFILRACGVGAGFGRRIPETKVIAKIGAVFFQHSFSLRLPAIVVGAPFVKRTVQAAVQVRPTEGAEFLSADKKVGGKFFLTSDADLHEEILTGDGVFLSSVIGWRVLFYVIRT